ncbi:hypothetical protein [Kocuria kalidii]|uniref:hypothetical protein n=1 Tax=Kocuria kalidii TaxID=3376283 RepID=UPI00379B9586
MTVQIDKHAWRRALAIGILPFAALGVAGCENTETAGGGEEQEQGQEQEGGEEEDDQGQEQEGGEEEDD